MGHVLLARPQQLHRRTVGLVREQRGLRDDIREIAPAEAATQVGHLDVDPIRLDVQRLRHRGVRESCCLRGRPDRRGAILELHGAIHRFHGRMREEGYAVFRIDDLGGRLHRRSDIAVRVMHLAILGVERMHQLIDEGAARQVGGDTVVPFDLDLRHSPYRMKRRVCDDGDTA